MYYYYDHRMTHQNIKRIPAYLLKKFYTTLRDQNMLMIEKFSNQDFQKELKEYFQTIKKSNEIIENEYINDIKTEILNLTIESNDFVNVERKNGKIRVETKFEYLHKYCIKNEMSEVVFGDENAVDNVYVYLNFEKNFVHEDGKVGEKDFEEGWKLAPPLPIYFFKKEIDYQKE